MSAMPKGYRQSDQVSEEEQALFEETLREAHAREAKTPVTRQVEGRNVVWAPQPGSQTAFMGCPIFEVLFHGTRGPGKRLEVSTPVLTDRGWVKAGEVTISDRLVALDGSYTKLLGIYPCNDRELFKVTFHDGAEILADAEHRWLTLNGKTGYREGGWKVRTTEQIRRNSVPYSVPYIQGPIPGKRWGGVDPYMVGLLLGDGTMRSKWVALYSADEEILEHASSLGWNRYKYEGQIGRATCPAAQDAQWRAVLPRALSGDKAVPVGLMEADAESRLAVLQGLMDSDGTIEECGKQRFCSKSEQLARDVAYLAWSLGGTASVYREDRPSPLGGVDWRWRVNLRHNNKFNPFRLSRKANRVVEQRKFLTRGIKSVEPAERGDGVCFAVEHPSKCFVIKDWVVTHNTDALLMSFAQHVGRGFGSAWRGIIFRQTYPQLGDIIAKSQKWFRQIFPSAVFNFGRMAWVWPSGETLLFRHMGRPEDYWNYHGHEYPFIGFEELTNWPSDECFRTMFACCRSTTPNIPHMVRATTNPYGVGHNWVKDRYRLHGRWWQTIVVDDGVDADGNKEPPRCALHGHIDENRVLLDADPNYRDTIAAAARNKAMKEAWLQGSWDHVAGGMFDDVWTSKNTVENFDIPRSWRIDRAFDWGSSKPFSVGWYAVSDGSDLKLRDGRMVATVRGDLFRVREWYGWTGRPNEGLRILAIDVAKGIVEREIAWGWRTGRRTRVQAGPADSSIFTVENGVSIAMDMDLPIRLDGGIVPGIMWIPADKRAGSRKRGWEMMRKMIAAVNPEPGLPREKPGLFIIGAQCPQFLRTVLALPRDEKDLDDVDTDAEDHVGDEVRYRVLAAGAVVKTIQTSGYY
jgi:hypothetical protein